MKQSTQLLIIGAGSLAKDIADLIGEFPGIDIVGFVIDQPPFERGKKLMGFPIYWIDEINEFDSSHRAICALARMKKIDIFKKVKSYGIDFIQFIHPSSRVSSSVEIGEGVVINSGVNIAVNSTLGKLVYVNRGSLIGHDTNIGDLSVISPGVNIAGCVNIGRKTYVGMGTIITEHVSIGEGCFICAGSLVTRDVPDHVKVIGAPARIIERDIGDF